LVEYALGIALTCVVCLGGISFLTDSSADHMADSGERVGAPDLEAGTSGGTGGTDGGSTTGGGDPGDPAPATLTAAAPTQSATRRGNSWDATITLTLLGDGSPVEGLLITGTWTLSIEGVVQVAESPVSCTTNTLGECIFTRDDMEWRTNRPEVTEAVFTVTDYVYTGSDPDQSYPIPPAPAQTVSVSRPA
jgi:hypothetical protein